MHNVHVETLQHLNQEIMFIQTPVIGKPIGNCTIYKELNNIF